MEIARTKAELAAHIEALRKQRKRIGLVPTMGALHAGHLSLIEIAKKYADSVVVSIFVNPTQFGEGEDLERYPRDEEQDLVKCEEQDVALVYIPTAEEMYPEETKATIQVPPELSDILCGPHRPGHFDGVATVVGRLFEHVTPDIAVFGEKDYQQLQVIAWLVESHALPVQIIPAPIIREEDGLALSSRNQYLSEEQRAIAPQLYQILKKIAEGTLPLENAKETLLSASFDKIDYIEIHNDRILAAAHLGTTRLIDNVAIKTTKE